MSNPALLVENLTVAYEEVPAVREVSLHVEQGEVVGLLGPNGAGKTTLLLAIAGLIPAKEGTVRALGATLGGEPAWKTVRRGIALVPDDRGIFPRLSVAEHFRLMRKKGDRTTEEFVMSSFPILESLLNRKASLLSGGEQQVLALAKALMMTPQLLLIDEMSLGLAPIIVESLMPIVQKVATDWGTSVLLVEQHADLALEFAHRIIVLNHGEITLESPSATLRNDRDRLEAAYFGLSSNDLDPIPAEAEAALKSRNSSIKGEI
jgi:branched-chain amino acid transport system ATP-binding protein